MKKNLSAFFLTGLFAVMLFYPDLVLKGAVDGLLLWFNTVLPTLFPFFLITGLLVESSAVNGISRILSPLLCPLFGICPSASIAVLGGFLCGYPMGARLCSSLASSGHISRSEGEYLLSFCNNASPMFIISYLFHQNLRRPDLALISLGILMLSPVLSSFLFRRRYPALPAFCEAESSRRVPGVSEGKYASFPELLDDVIASGCESIMKIGGYIIAFSILSSLLGQIPVQGKVWNLFFLPSLELTDGIQTIAGSTLPFSVKYILLMAQTSFGGLCAVFQTHCMIHGTGYSVSRYIKEKLVTVLVTSLLSYSFALIAF